MTLQSLLQAAPGPGGQASEAAIAACVAELAAPTVAAVLARDPYWPKWEGPWWQIRLLQELELADRIPAAAIDGLATALEGRFLPDYTRLPLVVPAGVDPNALPCPCQVGCVVHAFAAAGAGDRWPAAKGWLRHHQLPDGGLNCDEAAHGRPVPRSSMVSTLPGLEALLAGDLADADMAFLNRGADYLLERKLYLSLSKGGPIDPRWLTPIFPRFYEYDVLRGLTFVVRWASRLGRPLAWAAIADVVEALGAAVADHGFRPRPWLAAEGTLREVDGVLARGQAAGSFPLLAEVGDPTRPSPWLQREWRAALLGLVDLEARGLLA